MKRLLPCLLAAACSSSSAGGAGPAGDGGATITADAGDGGVAADGGPPTDAGGSAIEIGPTTNPDQPLTLRSLRSTEGTVSGTTSAAILVPNDAIAGDLVVAVAELVVSDPSSTIASPAGWVEAKHVVTSGAHHTFVWSRVLTAANEAPVITMSGSGTMSGGILSVAFGGARGTIVPDALGYEAPADQVHVSPPPTAPPKNEDFLVVAYAIEGDAPGTTLASPFEREVHFQVGALYGAISVSAVATADFTSGFVATINKTSGQTVKVATAALVTVKD